MRRLLKKTSIDRLDFLKLILMKKRITAKELTDLGGFSQATIRRLFTELNNDFYEVFGNRSTILRQEDQRIYSVLSDLSPNRLFHEMKLHYLQQTPQFNLLYAIATAQNGKTVSDLCATFDISTSYLYQVIREINQMIAGYEVQVARKDDTAFVLEGNEKYIRLLIYVLSIHSYQGLPSHTFIQDNQEAMKFIQAMELSPSEQEQLLLIFSMLKLRLSGGHRLQPMSKESTEILDKFHVSRDIALFQKQFLWDLLEEEEAVWTEIYYLRLMLRVLVYSYETSKQKGLLGKQFWLMDNELTHFCRHIFQSVLETYHVELEEDYYYESFFYFVLLHVFLEAFPLELEDVFVLNFSHRSLNLEVNAEQIETIKAIYKKELNTYFPQFLEVFKPAQYDYMASQLHLLLQLPKIPAVKIFIHYSQNFLGEMMIRQRLAQMFHEDVLQITTDIQQADVILSDSIEYDYEQVPHFFLYDATSKRVWMQLYRYLQKKITEKMFQKNQMHDAEQTDLSPNEKDMEIEDH